MPKLLALRRDIWSLGPGSHQRLPPGRHPYQGGRYLSLLGPQGGLQLSTGQKAIFKAGKEGEEVPSRGEMKGGPLDAILAHQHQGPTSFCCRGKNDRKVSLTFVLSLNKKNINNIELYQFLFTPSLCVKKASSGTSELAVLHEESVTDSKTGVSN